MSEEKVPAFPLTILDDYVRDRSVNVREEILKAAMEKHYSGINTLLAGYISWVALQDPCSPFLSASFIVDTFKPWWDAPPRIVYNVY